MSDLKLTVSLYTLKHGFVKWYLRFVDLPPIEKMDFHKDSIYAYCYSSEFERNRAGLLFKQAPGVISGQYANPSAILDRFIIDLLKGAKEEAGQVIISGSPSPQKEGDPYYVAIDYIKNKEGEFERRVLPSKAEQDAVARQRSEVEMGKYLLTISPEDAGAMSNEELAKVVEDMKAMFVPRIHAVFNEAADRLRNIKK